MATGAAREICETCGATLHAESPAGLCPACLLTTAIEEGDSEEFVSGSRIQDYELLNEVARGGMGIVYRARQRVPPRVVALKMILPAHVDSADAMKRFRAETEAAASLEHEGILPIYAVGEHDGAPFYSMKFAEGGTLSAQIENYRDKAREAAALIAKLARAVAFAHEHGILHRDLKPGNVLFDSAGKPYVSDFGLAKWLARESDLTQTFAVLGTPFYMAPEQAVSSNLVTEAADIYSLGAILYHLLTGHPPFTGETPMEVLRRAENQPAPRPRLTNRSIPADLETICLKCLEKDPAWRYPSATALANDLDRFCTGRSIQARPAGIFVRGKKWVQRNPASALLAGSLVALAAAVGWNIWKSELISRPITKGIAVLPFANLSQDPDSAYFADGVQNEILTRLAALRDLKVISRTSTAKYQSKPDNLKTVAQELGVSTILEGAVQKAGEKVRVNVQLIDGRADTHLWAKSYDRDFKDVFAVESEVSQEIAEALQANLSPSESHALAAAGTRDAEAYDLFLRGEYEFDQALVNASSDAFDRAEAFYRQALARDPNFADASAALARSRLERHWWISPLTATELQEVKSIIDRALALAPNSPEAHWALGQFFYRGRRQYENALNEFSRTLELQPNNFLVRFYRAAVYRRLGQWERSLADFQRAQELNPRDSSVPQDLGGTYLHLRLWKDAERAELRALAANPHDWVPAEYLLNIRLSATGDVDYVRRTFDGFPEDIKSRLTPLDPGGTGGRTVVDIIGGWPGRLDVLQRHFSRAFQALEKEGVNTDRGRLAQLARRVALRVLAGQPDAAKSAGEQVLPLLEARVRERPDDFFSITGLSWVYLALGRNADALRLSRQAADSISIEKDAFSGPTFQTALAEIEARAGAPEEAVKRLRRLLSIPAGHKVSIGLLKIDPVWDPIRNRPDFQQLLSGPEQIGPNK